MCKQNLYVRLTTSKKHVNSQVHTTMSLWYILCLFWISSKSQSTVPNRINWDTFQRLAKARPHIHTCNNILQIISYLKFMQCLQTFQLED